MRDQILAQLCTNRGCTAHDAVVDRILRVIERAPNPTDELLRAEIVQKYSNYCLDEGLDERYYWAARHSAASDLLALEAAGTLEERLEPWIGRAREDAALLAISHGWPGGWPTRREAIEALAAELQSMGGAQLIEIYRQQCCQRYR